MDLESVPLFEGLSSEDIHFFCENVRRTYFPADMIILHEGDEAEDAYLVLSGELEVLKTGSDGESHVIQMLNEGRVVGEVGFLDGSKRSATVRGVSASELLAFSEAEVRKLAETNPRLIKILRNLNKAICLKLRNSGSDTAGLLKDKLDAAKAQVQLSKMYIVASVLMCFISFYNVFAINQIQYVTSSTSLTVPLMLVIIVIFIFKMRTLKLPWSVYGLTDWFNLRVALRAVLYSIPICLAVLAVKWLFIHFLPSYAGRELFEPYGALKFPSLTTMQKSYLWYRNLAIYIIFVCPFQELLARSGLQAPLEHLFVGKYGPIWAIVVSNMIFMTAHVFMSTLTALLIFIPGLFFAWLFYRYKILIAPIIAHMLVGSWGLFIVGIL